ncbi:MAG: phosphoenolpyruvate carboxylase [Opitutaceae bacterium]|nr:phosphoenolpyruvate carboxylase [Opitutaceae bacterium]
MRKADMGIARLYASLVEDEGVRERMLRALADGFARAGRAILAITGRKQLLACEPVVAFCSILRSPPVFSFWAEGGAVWPWAGRFFCRIRRSCLSRRP